MYMPLIRGACDVWLCAPQLKTCYYRATITSNTCCCADIQAEVKQALENVCKILPSGFQSEVRVVIAL